MLRLESYARAAHQLSFVFSLDGARYHGAHWYDSVDLLALEQRFGAEHLERLYAHVAAFEVNKLASLRPDALDLGPLARWWTPALADVWSRVFTHVWAQWRYENALPHLAPPPFVHAPTASALPATRYARSGRPLLACGGGKDSLVACRLLDRAGVSYDTLGYSHSVYGASAPQHQLIEQLRDRTGASHHHRIWMHDDFLDAPVLRLSNPRGVRTLTAAETPASLFAALPVLLAHGLSALVVGHEHSADVGNLVWAEEGTEVNHQWGKSTEAERLLAGYVHAHLLEDAGFYSVLKPIHDVVIFELLRQDLDLLPFAHSCNVAKPWCRRCAKCAYVWLGYVGHLPRELIDSLFHEDLTLAPANELHFRQLLGLEAHTPFECVGRVDEARLALRLALRTAPLSPRALALDREVGALDVEDILVQHAQVDGSYARMAPEVAAGVLPQLRAAAQRVQARVRLALGAPG